VVAPAPESGPLVARLNLIPSAPLHATAAPSQGAARRLIRDDAVSAALVINPAAKTDTLLIASAGGSSEASAAEQVNTAAEASQHRSVTVTDIVPSQRGDGRGLTGFYLVVGCSVGGYLVAALLGMASGRPATTRRALNRLIAFGSYAIVSGLAGAFVVGPVLGALTCHLVALWWLGVLLVFAVGAVTLAFQILFGVAGIGITIRFFVIFRNPSAGGAYQPALLPPFWRAISSALPNGAATDSVRRIVYFGGHDIGGHLIVLASYAVAGVVIAIIGSIIHERRSITSARFTGPHRTRSRYRCPPRPRCCPASASSTRCPAPR